MRKGETEICYELLDAAFAAGVNMFDTARGYGESERVIGDWILQRGVREQIVVQTKGGLHGVFGGDRIKENCIRSDLEKSLLSLKCDYADIYLLHRDDENTDVGWIVELMNEFLTAGKIRAYGVSNWSHIRIDIANEYAYKRGLRPIEFSQPHFGLCEADKFFWIKCRSVTGKGNALAREWYRKSDVALQAYSPLCGGLLSGRVKSGELKSTKKNMSFAMRRTFLTPRVVEENAERLRRAEELACETGYSVPQIALAWTLGQKYCAQALLGSSRPDNLLACIAASDIELTDHQSAYLNLEREDFRD